MSINQEKIWAALESHRDMQHGRVYQCTSVHLWPLDASGCVTVAACGQAYPSPNVNHKNWSLPDTVSEKYAIKMYAQKRCFKCEAAAAKKQAQLAKFPQG